MKDSQRQSIFYFLRDFFESFGFDVVFFFFQLLFRNSNFSRKAPSNPNYTIFMRDDSEKLTLVFSNSMSFLKDGENCLGTAETHLGNFVKLKTK